MSQSVFFSWQSDTVSKVGRNFIEQALNRAVGAINSDLEVQDADRPDTPSLVIDKDTQRHGRVRIRIASLRGEQSAVGYESGIWGSG